MSPRVWGCWKSLWSPVFLCNHPDGLKHWNRRAWKPCGNWANRCLINGLNLIICGLPRIKTMDSTGETCARKGHPQQFIYIYIIYIYMLPLRWYIFSLPLKHLHEVVPQKNIANYGPFLRWQCQASWRLLACCWRRGWVQFSGEEHLWCVMKLGLLCFLEVGDSNMDGDGPAYLYSAFRPQYSALFWENPTSKFCPHLPVRWHQELLQSLLLTVSMKNAIFSMKTTTISI